MIRFNPQLLSVEIVSLKTITTSLGGSITVVDDARTTDKEEVHKRVEVPMAVARAFIMKTKKVTRYLKPVLTALVRYDGTVVAMERHALGSMGTLVYEDFEGVERQWEPAAAQNIKGLVVPLVNRPDREWYFDGRYVFSFASKDVDHAITQGEFLTSDGRFRQVMAMSVDLQELSNKEKLEPVERSCLGFVSNRGAMAVSPPIWKKLSDVGGTQLGKLAKAAQEDDDLDEEDKASPVEGTPEVAKKFNFDEIDNGLAVNLNFALKAGQEIGKTFGYEQVEPLGLPRLMIELHTVNLPNVPSQIKSTYDVGIKFTHALAWLLGMSRNANTLETYVMMRSLMKYLTMKGIFRNNTFDANSIFKEEKTIADVPQLVLNDLLEDNTTQMSLSAILQQARRGIKARKKAEEDIHQFGGMLNEE